MQYQVKVILFMLLSACTPTKDIAMTNQLLAVKTSCKGSDPCFFEDQDVFLDIRVTNNQQIEIGFPLEYVRKTGPVIRLIDTRTKAETYLKNNLADLDLQQRFTPIAPGQSVALEWVVMSDELRQFGGRSVDLSAEITLKTLIQVSGKPVEFRGTDTLRIVSKDKP